MTLFTGSGSRILAEISNLPKQLRERLAEEFPMGLPGVERRYDSTDGTCRYLLKLSDGKTVETVGCRRKKALTARRSAFRARSAAPSIANFA